MNKDRLRDGLKELMENYSIDKYGKDWDYCFGLSFKYGVKDFINCRSLMNSLWKRMSKECLVDGIYVMEYGKNGKINVHGLMVSELSNRKMSNVFKKYWGSNYGVFWLEKFDRDKGNYDLYMIKDYYKKNLFDYDLISNVY